MTQTDLIANRQASATVQKLNERKHDAINRVLEGIGYTSTGTGVKTGSLKTAYDLTNRALAQRSYDAAGAAKSTTLQRYSDDGTLWATQERQGATTTMTSNTAYTYQWFGGAAQSSITKTNGVGATSTTGYSQFYYDANGRLKAVYNPTATKQQLREYETDANGQIVQRRETEELNG